GLHPLHEGVGVVCTRFLDTAQVERCSGVITSLQEGGHALVFVVEALGPFAGFIVHVPVPATGQVHALCGIQPQCVDIVDEHQQACQVHAGRHAEFTCCLDRVDEVAPRVSQTENLRAGGLCLQHEG